MTTIEDLIDRRHDDIVRRWADEVARTRPASLPATEDLPDAIPRYLRTLRRRDVDAELDVKTRQQHLLERYLVGRIHDGYQLPEIIAEIETLYRCIIRVWREVAPASASDADGVEYLFAGFQRAASHVGRAFSSRTFGHEQDDRTHIRRLRWAAASVHGDERESLSDRLGDVLAVVANAMGAANAAVVLYRPGVDVVAASSARPCRLVERCKAASGAALVERLAERLADDAGILAVASSDDEVGTLLRASGHRVALGLRTATRRGFVMVAYVSYREPRPFDVNDLWRLAGLAVALGELCDALQAQVELAARVRALDGEHIARDRFVAIIAHDLRGPLSVARAAAQQLQRHHPEPSQSTELSTRIIRSIDRADRMVRDLLDAQRIRAGESLALVLGPCDLSAIAREVVADLVAIHGVRYELDAPVPVPGVWSEDDLRRALWNLLTNATKYGDPSGVIGVVVRPHSDGAELSVHNEGAAIPDAARTRLFEPFKQLEPGSTTHRRGWGLGLTLVHGCAAAHGGSIEVASAEGSGTTFTLHLPTDSRAHRDAPVS